MAGEWGLADIKERIRELQEKIAMLNDGDKGDVIIQDDQILLDDIDAGTFN
jgi:hypothetical protein